MMEVLSIDGKKAAQCADCGTYCQLVGMPTDDWGVSYCSKCWEDHDY